MAELTWGRGTHNRFMSPSIHDIYGTVCFYVFRMERDYSIVGVLQGWIQYLFPECHPPSCSSLMWLCMRKWKSLQRKSTFKTNVECINLRVNLKKKILSSLCSPLFFPNPYNFVVAQCFEECLNQQFSATIDCST